MAHPPKPANERWIGISVRAPQKLLKDSVVASRSERGRVDGFDVMAEKLPAMPQQRGPKQRFGRTG
eukprot:7984164-Pyramimonas_sp.AAC.1